jgi:hypothetical protein
MWSYSSPTRNHASTADWVRGHLLHGKTKYVFAAVVAVLIIVFVTLFVMYSRAMPASHIVTNYDDMQAADTPAPIEAVNPKPTKEVSSDVKTNVEATINSSDSNGAVLPQTELKVNNQEVRLPANGSVNKSIESKDGNTNIDISVKSNSKGNVETDSSTSIQLNTTSESETSIMKSD